MDLRRLVALALVAVTLAPPGAAHATDAVVGPQGLPCRLVPTGDLSSDARTGIVLGGPYVATGTLTCTVRGGYLGTSASASATGGPAVMVPPTPVAYTMPAWSPVGVCTSFTPDGGPTLYLEQPTPADLGHWTTYPGACGWMLDTKVSGLNPGDFLNCACDPGWEDFIICGYFQSAYPGAPPAVEVKPDGDVWVGGVWFWDCPPYGS